MEDRKKEGLSALGHETRYKMDYAPEVLETFENMHPGRDYWVRFNCPEFTTLCPISPRSGSAIFPTSGWLRARA